MPTGGRGRAVRRPGRATARRVCRPNRLALARSCHYRSCSWSWWRLMPTGIAPHSDPTSSQRARDEGSGGRLRKTVGHRSGSVAPVGSHHGKKRTRTMMKVMAGIELPPPTSATRGAVDVLHCDDARAGLRQPSLSVFWRRLFLGSVPTFTNRVTRASSLGLADQPPPKPSQYVSVDYVMSLRRSLLVCLRACARLRRSRRRFGPPSPLAPSGAVLQPLCDCTPWLELEGGRLGRHGRLGRLGD